VSGQAPWRQLPLPFPHEPRFHAADFLEGPSNTEALAWLRRVGEWPQGRLLLWGPEDSGKTHLLHVWAERMGARLLPASALPRMPEPVTCPLAIDDAETAPERPLLSLLNGAAEAGWPVLLAARTPPARWAVALPDLASRLRAITPVEILPPDGPLLRALLAKLLAERQLRVAEPVQDWLLLRLPRTPAALREAVARLDRAGLVAGRAVTRAIAAEVVRALTDSGAVPDPDGSHQDFMASSRPAPLAAPCLL